MNWPPPDPDTVLTFDQVVAAGLDGTLRDMPIWNEHLNHNIIARSTVWETHRTEIEDGIVFITKNDDYETVEFDFWCHDCCVAFSLDDQQYEWAL